MSPDRKAQLILSLTSAVLMFASEGRVGNAETCDNSPCSEVINPQPERPSPSKELASLLIAGVGALAVGGLAGIVNLRTHFEAQYPKK